MAYDRLQQTAKVRASDDPSRFGPQDYVFCTLKSHQAYNAAPSMPPLLGPELYVRSADLFAGPAPGSADLENGAPVGAQTTNGRFAPTAAVPYSLIMRITTADGADFPCTLHYTL
jgi:hypothetical protein